MSALTIASKASTGSTLTEVPGINSGVSHLQELGRFVTLTAHTRLTQVTALQWPVQCKVKL